MCLFFKGKPVNHDYYPEQEQTMCLLTQIKDLLASGSIKTANDVVSHLMQLVAYYEQNAANKDEPSKKDAFIDACIQVLQQSKSKPA